ncbi:type I restriction endonuclease subunit R [Acinetobacter rudis]|uniref:Type I restriction enzyme endonuclease subunit n=1 Tax=Acinetobacter rudis CIP 110305 TaxID=421052 RepID=S3N7V1_9GAMM|nr:type I restriction endonuclease subunit R [Acinetobacter rudis]EPF70369.1 type I restriction enzyme, R subunit [Acinetobacter rudis CIP 110305]
MSIQSEAQLEYELIKQLKQLGYSQVAVKDEAQLLSNLKIQIERANGIAAFSHNEWAQVLNHLKAGNSFNCAKVLRNRFPVTFDDGSTRHIDFLFADPQKNIYQVTHQISVDHKAGNGHSSRFDVTLLINGLPLVQIELKRAGVELPEAFNQTQRYAKDAYSSGTGLFNYIQLFVISNRDHTHYYSTGTSNFEFTFPWADFDNKHIHKIDAFAECFLNHQHISKMLTEYMVVLEVEKRLMVLRPYQIYAVQQIIQRVQHSEKNGYIWHTTGSGKTLTSFKASQLIMRLPEVEKVLFVVDRSDLDTQTVREFNAFKENSVDTTKNTSTLVDQLGQTHDKLIVTTLQKLNIAISSNRYADQIAYLKDKKVVIIFDECHRSQFGDTHRNIKRFFDQAQMFGFTGTPIFETNSQVKIDAKAVTTNALFDECLHKYVITDAIRDGNVLPFQIAYLGKYTSNGIEKSDSYEDDVEGIDTKELFDNPARLEMITRYIVDNHHIKTKNRTFTAMFCVSSVEVLTQYYELFKQVQQEKQQQAEEQGQIYNPLSIATIFSFAANEERTVEEFTGLIEEESADIPTKISQSNRDKLDQYITEYNAKFGQNFNSGEEFYPYYRDIANRVRKKEIDILLVVNMFLTGFDSKPLNTLYVDKNLKYHGLIQAFSRTNRILNADKPFGNIVCFRNLKQATDQALTLFSNRAEAEKIVLIPSFESIKEKYNAAVENLLCIVPDPDQVSNTLVTEQEQLAYVKAFREVMRINAQLENFVEYDQDDTLLNKADFQKHTSQYKYLYNNVRIVQPKDKVSVLNDVNFQLELIHRDTVNVGYILNLLQAVVNNKDEEKKRQYRSQVQEIISTNHNLYDKQVLIQKFLDENIPRMANGQSVHDAFATFWDVEKEKALGELCQQEALKPEVFKAVLGQYEYTKRLPSREDVKDLPITRPKISERKTLMNTLVLKTRAFIEKFYTGL